MTSTEWHVGPELLDRYAAAAVDDVARAAIETHVTSCRSCREQAAALRPASDLDPVWEAIALRIAAPRSTVLVRIARRLGIRETDITLLRASTSLAVPFVLALCACLTFALASTTLRPGAQQTFYLTLAPLLPAILIGAAYDATDPIREICAATAFPQLRIALVRTITATGLALPLMVSMSLVPHISLGLSAWLLPALTLATLTLTLLTWLRALPAVVVVATGWLAIVVWQRAIDAAAGSDRPAAQLAYVAVLVASAVVFAGRLGLFVRKEAQS